MPQRKHFFYGVKSLKSTCIVAHQKHKPKTQPTALCSAGIAIFVTTKVQKKQIPAPKQSGKLREFYFFLNF
jgi:hypothetical protein